MTICLVSLIAPESLEGVGTFNHHFIQLFRTHHHKVIFVFVDTEKNTNDTVEVADEFYNKIVLSASFFDYYKNLKTYFRPGGGNSAKWIAAGLAVRKWLLQNHLSYAIDIIETSDGGGLGIFLADKRLPPVVLTGHGSMLQISAYDYTAYDEHGTVIKHLEKLSYQYTDALIPYSIINERSVKSFTQKPVFMLPTPFIASTSIEGGKEYNYGIAVGKLRYFKGPHLLCKALEKNKTVTVQWIGADTATIKNSKSVSAYLKGNFPTVFNINFMWRQPLPHHEVLSEIKKARFIVIPSVWETFSYVAIEAAAMGKPIIISKTTGAAYLFTNKVNALIIDSDNEDELSNALSALENDKFLREYLGTNARQMITEKLAPSLIVNKRIEVYRKVIAGRIPPRNELEDNIAFLKKYLTQKRKIYFLVRARLKSVLKK